MQASAESGPISLFEYFDVLKRRRLLFLAPALIIVLIALYLALSPPSTYRSAATILIEEQQLPADIVGATISNYASQQIQLVSQRLLTVKNIEAVVDKFDVYGPKKFENPVPATTIARWFREDMELDLVSTDVIGPRGPGQAAIAFTLAFSSTDPLIAQQVTEELVELFLSENERSSASKTTGVSTLLKAAAKDANDALVKTEAELANFKSENEGALPELYQLNLNVINRTAEQLSDVNLRIQELEQRKLQLSAQLTSLSPTSPVTLPSGETIMSDRDRLRALLVDFRRKSAIYQPGHPDLEKLEREIEILRGTVGASASRDILREQLRQERASLESLREKYSEDYPDVVSSKATISAIEVQLAESNSQGESQLEVPDNPAYVLINTQLQSANLEIQSLLEKQQELRNKIGEHETLIAQAPRVEMQYEALLRDYENARANYNDLQARLRAADVASNVEQKLTGQRFTLLEPPALPLYPDGPNRQAILVLGIVMAIGVGLGCVLLVELLDKSIRSAKKLADIAGAPPLAVIPYLNNSEDLAQQKSRRSWIIIVSVAGGVFLIAFIHFLMRPI